jgi:hypothetical protein
MPCWRARPAPSSASTPACFPRSAPPRRATRWPRARVERHSLSRSIPDRRSRRSRASDRDPALSLFRALDTRRGMHSRAAARTTHSGWALSRGRRRPGAGAAFVRGRGPFGAISPRCTRPPIPLRWTALEQSAAPRGRRHAARPFACRQLHRDMPSTGRSCGAVTAVAEQRRNRHEADLPKAAGHPTRSVHGRTRPSRAERRALRAPAAARATDATERLQRLRTAPRFHDLMMRLRARPRSQGLALYRSALRTPDARLLADTGRPPHEVDADEFVAFARLRQRLHAAFHQYSTSSSASRATEPLHLYSSPGTEWQTVAGILLHSVAGTRTSSRARRRGGGSSSCAILCNGRG